jgi:peptidoglycan/LPS O-acetylase OafA/YrhL
VVRLDGAVGARAVLAAPVAARSPRLHNLEVAKSSSRVEALTGARALAGLYILLLHFGAPLFARAPGWAQTLRAQGYVATSYFLMLSGFVLTIAYGPRFVDGRIDRRSFLIQRVARVYPGYALALALLVPLALVHRWGAITAAFGDEALRYKLVTGVASASMTHVFVPRLVSAWNVPGWCVSVEMWFYLGFPLVVTWLLARRLRSAVAVMAGAFAVTLALSIAYTVVRPDGETATLESTGFWLTLFKFTPYTRWTEFLFGVALGALFVQLPAERRGRRWANALAGGGALATVAILAEGDRIPYTLLHNGTLLPLYGAMVWGLMLGDGPLHRALAARPLTTVGNASYVLYILQAPLMQWMILVSGRHAGELDARFTAVALVVIVAASIALHHLYEKPAQAWLRARLERWSTVLSPQPKRASTAPIATSATT